MKKKNKNVKKKVATKKKPKTVLRKKAANKKVKTVLRKKASTKKKSEAKAEIVIRVKQRNVTKEEHLQFIEDKTTEAILRFGVNMYMEKIQGSEQVAAIARHIAHASREDYEQILGNK